MKTLSQEALSILAIALLICSVTGKSSSSDVGSTSAEYSDYYYYDSDLDSNSPSTSVKPCPRDCICSAQTDTRVAKCSRLEIGTQIFGDDVTGLEVTNSDRKHPLVLTDLIFYKMGLHKLTNMKLTNNIMIMLESTAFNSLNKLMSANLSNNHITDVDLNIFDKNPNLALVDLSDNPLSISKHDRAFLNSTSIQELEIARCGITKLSDKTFSLLKNIMYINLAGNKLQKIDPMLFANLIALEEVDLSDNFIIKIPDNLFADNPNITTLTLRGNPIKSVVGVEIKELLTIDLSLTDIRTVGPSMFSGMNILSNVNLSGSGISKIHNQAFHNLTFLNYLDLSDNNLDMISDQLIKENMELDIFKIARNPLLTKLPKDGFACANSTFNVYLFDASGCSIEILHDNTFKTMSTLSQLLLGDNQITTVGKSLYLVPKLIKIDLSNNLITTLDKNTFSRNVELGTLYLSGNPLKVLSPELFIDNPNLAWLDVSYCELTSLWTLGSHTPRAIMNNLHFINASNNEIEVIKRNELDIINKLFTLDISENPLQCNLDFEVLMTWLGDHRVSPGAKDIYSAELSHSGNTKEKREKWDALAKSVCKSEPVKPIVINQIVPAIDTKNEKSKNGTAASEFFYVENDDDDDNFYDNYDDDSEEDVYDESYIANKKNAVKVTEIVKNAEKVNKIMSNADKKEASDDIDENTKKLMDLVSEISNNIDKDKINIPLADEMIKDSEKAEEELVEAYLEQDPYHRYRNVIVPLRITGFILAIILLLLGIAKLVKQCATKENSRVRCAVISLNPNRGEGRVKKDCGLVYQQLSEDLTGPKTPIISRHLLGINNKNKFNIYSIDSNEKKATAPENV